MKIAFIIPGSGGQFYCSNCLKDKALVKALKQAGHDVMVIPMYLPLGEDQAETELPIFYGAVNIYLKQVFPLLKRMPAFLQRALNSDSLLRFAGKLSGSTRAQGNEAMTISMLKGARGKQAEDLDELIRWLRDHEKPDVVHLSNALLSGLAEKIKTELKCAVVCTLQDEDEWIDAMREPYASQTWQLIESNAEHMDALIAVSAYYADLIRSKIKTDPAKIHLVSNSVDPDTLRKKQVLPGEHCIGYMSKINSIFGADVLFDAFVELKKEAQFSGLKLSYTGGYTDDYKKVVKEIKQKAGKYQLEKDLSFHDDLSEAGKKQFLDNISLFCVPSQRKESFGIQLLEAFAAEVPCIMPDIGAYPEIIEKSQAGLLYQAGDLNDLVDKLRQVLSNESFYRQLREQCHKSLNESFHFGSHSKNMLAVYQQCLKRTK